MSRKGRILQQSEGEPRVLGGALEGSPSRTFVLSDAVGFCRRAGEEKPWRPGERPAGAPPETTICNFVINSLLSSGALFERLQSSADITIMELR